VIGDHATGDPEPAPTGTSVIPRPLGISTPYAPGAGAYEVEF